MTSSPRRQRTISNTVRVSGFGYWSGLDIQLEFRPAPVDTGIVFVRCDLDRPQRIPARVENRIEIPRRTSLAVAGQRVEMVEHVMAALAGLQIDNCEVWVDQPEMPGCDGSSLPFVEALLEASIVDQESPRELLVIKRPIRVGDDSSWVEARPIVSGNLRLDCLIDYVHPGPIGRQELSIDVTENSFRSELAPARTFVLEEEAAWMRQQGLGERVTTKDLLVFNSRGPIQNPLRFPDECVRHKTLDMVGDLALAGCDLVGHFVAHCSGHRLNAALVAAVRANNSIATIHRKSA